MMRAETRQSTAAAAQPPASEPPPPKPNFEPEDRPKKEPTKPEAFLARQRQLGSLGGKCAGSVGENKFLVEVAVDGRARCQLRTCKEPLKIGELRLGKRPPSLPVWKSILHEVDAIEQASRYERAVTSDFHAGRCATATTPRSRGTTRSAP